MSGLYADSWNMNSGSHICATSIFPTETSVQPRKAWVIVPQALVPMALGPEPVKAARALRMNQFSCAQGRMCRKGVKTDLLPVSKGRWEGQAEEPMGCEGRGLGGIKLTNLVHIAKVQEWAHPGINALVCWLQGLKIGSSDFFPC